jgi:hypothetical protein
MHSKHTSTIFNGQSCAKLIVNVFTFDALTNAPPPNPFELHRVYDKRSKLATPSNNDSSSSTPPLSLLIYNPPTNSVLFLLLYHNQ